MSQLMVAPELIAAAATDVAAVGSSLDAAHLAAAVPTVAVIPAAADEISAGIAHLFSQHAQKYQSVAAQAMAFNDQFAQHLNAGAHSYATAETANTASLAGAVPAASTGSALGDQVLTEITNWATTTINHVIANAVALVDNFITWLNKTIQLIFDLGNLAYAYFFVSYLLLGYGILGIQKEIFKVLGIIRPPKWPLIPLPG